jgi:hypothetical protein
LKWWDVTKPDDDFHEIDDENHPGMGKLDTDEGKMETLGSTTTSSNEDSFKAHPEKEYPLSLKIENYCRFINSLVFFPLGTN